MVQGGGGGGWLLADRGGDDGERLTRPEAVPAPEPPREGDGERDDGAACDSVGLRARLPPLPRPLAMTPAEEEAADAPMRCRVRGSRIPAAISASSRALSS